MTNTLSPTPTEGKGAATGVRTNGLGQRSIRHLNLTVSLADADERRQRDKVRKYAAAERAEKTEQLLRRHVSL